MASLLVLFVFLFITSCSAQSYNVLSFGARSDGKIDATKSFIAVWKTACASSRPVTIVVPNGRFLLKSLNFDGSKCKPKPVTFRIDGTFVAPADYRVLGSQDYWILFQHLDGIIVYGGVSGIKISDVLFVDIHGTSATQVGVKLDCSSAKPCTGIRLEDVQLTYQNKPAASACTHAGGTEAGFFQPNCL